MVQVGFEPTPPKRLELESSALDHSAIEPLHDKLVIHVKLKTTTPAGFEPARAKPSRFRICLLNLSDKVPSLKDNTHDELDSTVFKVGLNLFNNV